MASSRANRRTSPPDENQVTDGGIQAPAIRHIGISTMLDAAATGVLHGNTITLDAPVPPFDR
jgi:hypothetical protein